MSILRRAICAAAAPVERLHGEIGFSRQYVFSPENPVFAGHFPGHPILPAVAQLPMAQTTLEECGMAVALTGVPEAKFLAPLAPSMALRLDLRPGKKDGGWSCTVYGNGAPAARFSLEVVAP